MTTTKTTAKKDLKRAEELMRTMFQVAQNKKELTDRIKNELDAYNTQYKEAEKELIEIGERNKDEFDEKGNLVFDDGYLHITNSTVVVQGRNFDITTFNEAHPELMDIKLKTGEIKKAFLDKEFRKELIKLGVQVDNEQGMEVKLNKI